MEIKKITVEYDDGTIYIAEGEDARTWRKWMLDAEDILKKKGWWIWGSWTQIIRGHDTSQITKEGPDEPK
jgi:hypothetical protein